MQILIEISKEMLSALKSGKLKHGSIAEKMIVEAIKDGTPLPKGHGRLIDADDIDNHIIGHVDTRSCPTIIPADKEESE